MKVKELINNLSIQNPELPVIINLTAYGSTAAGNIQKIKRIEECIINEEDNTSYRAIILHWGNIKHE